MNFNIKILTYKSILIEILNVKSVKYKSLFIRNIINEN